MAALDVAGKPDRVAPLKVEHVLDEGFEVDSGELIYHYNYLRYEFAHSAGVIWARAYLTDISTVSLFLPEAVGLDDDVVQNVIAFFRRRFPQVERFGPAGYERI
jgi:hypothetical protein